MEDAKIVALYFDRDEAAIAETEAKYGGYCYTVANRILRSAQDSEECVSDTWLRAWNTIPPQKPSRLQLFLGKITRNLAFDRFRAIHSQKRGGGETVLALQELKECVSEDGDPAAAAQMRALESAINSFLRKLPERDRRIFLRRYFYVDEIPDIAKGYGLKAANVRLILSRTRQKLRTFLQKEGF